MDESVKKIHVDGGDREILYSRAIKAGQRIYYLDVKKNLRDDLFVAVTESKKVQSKDNTQISFEKHKIFLYKEDFEKFMDGMQDVIAYIQNMNQARHPEESEGLSEEKGSGGITSGETDSGDIKLDIEF